MYEKKNKKLFKETKGLKKSVSKERTRQRAAKFRLKKKQSLTQSFNIIQSEMVNVNLDYENNSTDANQSDQSPENYIEKDEPCIFDQTSTFYSS